MASREPVKIGIACDHAAVDLKKAVAGWLTDRGHEVEDLGTHGHDSVDYPDFAERVARGILEKRFGLGVLVCGTGIGMSIVANRFPGVRAALCTSAYMARMARAHNDANVLCLGARVVGTGLAEDILRTFTSTEFEGGRHARRIGKADTLGGRSSS
jgi:ribose 5-phosphate isomerase B